MHVRMERTERPHLILRRVPPFAAAPVALVPILIVAALLRFVALPKRGLIYWDEGKFSLEGLRLLAAIHTLFGSQSSSLVGKAIGTAKPTHALLIALAYAVVGVHDYAPLMLSATASVAEVALLYLFGRRLFGSAVALLAALLLAVSGYDVVYARSALSESDANLFFLAGVYLWSGSVALDAQRGGHQAPVSGNRRLLAGLLLGLGLTTNYRLIVYIAVLVAVDLALLWRRKEWQQSLAALLLWCVGIAACPLTWELVDVMTRVHGLILFRSETTHHPTSYIFELLYQLHGGKQAVLQFDLLLYVQWYLVRQGWPMLLLLLAGFGLAAAKRSAEWMVPTALVLGPYLIFSFAPFIVPRNLDATLPFSSILAAAALVRLVGFVRWYRLTPLLLGALVLILTMDDSALSWRLTAERSGFARAVGYVRRHGSENALIVNEVLRFYLRDPGTSCDAPALPGSLPLLEAAVRSGDQYAILDRFGSPLARYLVSHVRPVARYLAAGSLSLGEDPIASENGYPPGQMPDRSRYIDVYTLDSLHVSGAYVRRPPTCSLERVA